MFAVRAPRGPLEAAAAAAGLGLLLLLQTPSAGAADPKPEAKAEAKPDTKADGKADAAEAAAAMERARRQAANPMRVIMEASKVRRKVTAEPDVVPVAAPVAAAVRSTVVPVAASSGNAPGAVPVTPTLNPVANAAVPSGTSTPVGNNTAAAAVPAPAATAAVDEATRQPPLRRLSAAGVSETSDLRAPAAAAAPMQALGSETRVAPAPAPVQAVATPRDAVDASPIRPKLVDMVEPAIPQRVLDELGRLVEISADVTIRADGSVASVSVLPPAPRQVVRYVVTALERWRFEPLPEQRIHRVQLVFNEQ